MSLAADKQAEESSSRTHTCTAAYLKANCCDVTKLGAVFFTSHGSQHRPYPKALNVAVQSPDYDSEGRPAWARRPRGVPVKGRQPPGPPETSHGNRRVFMTCPPSPRDRMSPWAPSAVQIFLLPLHQLPDEHTTTTGENTKQNKTLI